MSEGCIRLPSAIFQYLRTLSRTSALEVYLYLAKEGALETWTAATKSGLAQELAKSRNTIAESLAVLLELGLIEERIGATGSEYSMPVPVCTSCGISCGKPQFVERFEDENSQGAKAQVIPIGCTVSEQQTLLEDSRCSISEQAEEKRQGEFPLVDDGECTVSEHVDKKSPLSLDLEGLEGLKDLDLLQERPSRLQQVFDHWNSKGVVKHRFVTADMEKRIGKRLEELDAVMSKDESLAEALKAIDNFATVLLSPEYRWTYSWDLATFFMRENGFHKFRDEARPLERERVVVEHKATRDFTAARGADAFAGL